MPWTSPFPTERWQETDVRTYLREIYTRLKFGTVTVNPGNVSANSTLDTAVTVDGLRTGMPVFVSPPSTLDSGIAFAGAWVASNNTLTIRLANVTAGGINPASATWAYAGVI